MKAARLPAYDQDLSIEDVAAPEVRRALRRDRAVGGAGLCRTDLHIIEGIWKEKDRRRAALHPRPRERRLGRGRGPASAR